MQNAENGISASEESSTRYLNFVLQFIPRDTFFGSEALATRWYRYSIWQRKTTTTRIHATAIMSVAILNYRIGR